MPILLGIDLGTTTITSLALDADTGTVLTVASRPHDRRARYNRDLERGYSEWDVEVVLETAIDGLREVANGVQNHRGLAALGVTGQQHGMLLVDSAVSPLTPFINWQDRRGEEHIRRTTTSYVEWARQRLGEDAPSRTGCRVATGYMAVTLLWLHDRGRLPPGAKACFLADFFTSRLTGKPLVTDPTLAASGGKLNVLQRDWDDAALKALDLSRALFPDVQPSAARLGGLTAEMAARIGLPAGLPVCVGIGDNQASFLGSVAEPSDSVLVNVGTGGQVSMWTDQFLYDPAMETRPFPGDGFLLVSAGLCGGKSYALLEQFFRLVGEHFFGTAGDASLFKEMNRLAASVPAGADGLRCEPFFTGTRAQPDLLGAWTGVSAGNFTPGHMARSLLEGMARAFGASYNEIARVAGQARRCLIGAGNGIRENPLLPRLIAEEFGIPLATPAHREEAAFGAALAAGVGVGVFADFREAARRVCLTG
jgi:sugar (pentulose or hexulose) kinase